MCSSDLGVSIMNKFFLPNSRKVLPTFRTFCPDGVRSAQMGYRFAHFQVQARLAVRHAVTVSLHAVKLLYTATFQWGLKIATHCRSVPVLQWRSARCNCRHVSTFQPGSANAGSQVSEYRHLALSPQISNPVLHSRSARCICHD